MVARNDDPRYPGVEIANIKNGSFGGATTYNGGFYIVEAEGIYVGYKYYETRYYDAVMGQGNASGASGATQGSSWNYSDEMTYTFGHGLSYLDYTQTLKSIDVNKNPDGLITAVVEVKNTSNQDGKSASPLAWTGRRQGTSVPGRSSWGSFPPPLSGTCSTSASPCWDCR